MNILYKYYFSDIHNGHPHSVAVIKTPAILRIKNCHLVNVMYNVNYINTQHHVQSLPPLVQC